MVVWVLLMLIAWINSGRSQSNFACGNAITKINTPLVRYYNLVARKISKK